MKYCVLLIDGCLELPVIFPSLTSHAEVANGRKVVSAGEVTITVDNSGGFGTLQVFTHGRSIGLNTQPRPCDAQLILNAFKKY